MRRFVKGLAALNILAFIVTAATVWLLGHDSITGMFDVATYVGLGIGALGALMFFGSASGSSASTSMAASASEQPGKMMEALWGDRTSGISTGALFVLGGISFLGIAWLLVALFGVGI